jgi:hypothetical protein
MLTLRHHLPLESPVRRFAALALAAILVPVAAACGDDKPGTEREFAVELCAATREFEASLSSALEQASTETDATKALEALTEPLEDFVKAFRDANPPEDLEDWHKEAGDQLDAVVERFKEEKTLASLEGFGDSPVPDPPAEAKQRLRGAAADAEECEGVAFLKPD